MYLHVMCFCRVRNDSDKEKSVKYQPSSVKHIGINIKLSLLTNLYINLDFFILNLSLI